MFTFHALKENCPSSTVPNTRLSLLAIQLTWEDALHDNKPGYDHIEAFYGGGLQLFPRLALEAATRSRKVCSLRYLGLGWTLLYLP